MAGYSKRSLPEKLGIKEGTEIGVLNCPANYDQTLMPLPEGISRVKRLKPSMGFIHFFTKKRAELSKRFPELKKHLAPKGILWISWPKGTSKVKTDLNENIVRDIGLANGMVDIKSVPLMKSGPDCALHFAANLWTAGVWTAGVPSAEAG